MGGDLAAEFITAAKGSQRYEIEIIGVNGTPSICGEVFADHFYQVPMGEASNYFEAILEIVKKHSVDLILPGSDGEALALSIKRDVLKEYGCMLANVDSSILQKISDKSIQYEILQKSGIPIAEWSKITTIEELDSSVRDMVSKFGEVVIKPAISRGGRNVIIIRNDLDKVESYFGGRELHMNLEIFHTKHQKPYSEHLPAIVMQRLFEPVFDLDILGWEGKPIVVVPRERHNPAGIPFMGNTIRNDSILIELGEKVISAFDLSWMYDVDVMTTADGKACVLEVNPRYSGSFPASIKAGIPLFDAIVALAKGEKLPPMNIPEGKNIIPYTCLEVVD
jgi:carbamoyl-phosphate synthase large subunit